MSRQLAESQNQFARDQARLNGTDLEQKVDQLVERMSTFEVMLNDMNKRLIALETWEDEPVEIDDFDPEEELIPVVRSPPKVQSRKGPRFKGFTRMMTMMMMVTSRQT